MKFRDAKTLLRVIDMTLHRTRCGQEYPVTFTGGLGLRPTTPTTWRTPSENREHEPHDCQLRSMSKVS